MRLRLDTTAAVLIDLGDQPPSTYVLVIDDAPGGRQAFAVDHWRVADGLVAGYRFGSVVAPPGDSLPIVVFPERYCWQILSRAVMEPVRLQDYIVRGLEDDKLMLALRKKLVEEEPQTSPTTEALNSDEAIPLARNPIVGHYL